MENGIQKVALLGNIFCEWGGGIDFLRFCVNALEPLCKSRNTKIILLLPDSENSTLQHKVKTLLHRCKDLVDAFFYGRKGVCYYRPFSKNQLRDSFTNIDGAVEIIFYPQGQKVATLVSRLKIDILIPSCYSLGPSFPIPWVGYLYDFQHKYYPENFSSKEIKARDEQFSKMLSDAKAVIVNAAEVKKDINKFFPKTNCKVFDLPFCATPLESWFEIPLDDLERKYNLPAKYFVICNQFWIHKDHETAFSALAIYSKLTGKDDVHIVCTGKTEDSRHPGYFLSLKESVRKLGLSDRIHFLGHIPKKDQIGIMLKSIAVLQPTLFEGGPGGGAIYDAIALGLPCVVSDIPVNREISGIDSLLFFKSRDANCMAEKMIEIEKIGKKKINQTDLLTIGRQRTLSFGLRLFDAIDYVCRYSGKAIDCPVKT